MTDKNFSKTILQMQKVDQDLRKAALKAQGGSPEPTPYNYLVYLADSVHNLKIHQLITRYGYPTKKLFGAKALKAFWLLVQHQDLDPELQQKCLDNCDFAPQEHAYLTDRVLVNAGKKQRYGTQFMMNKKTGRRELYPLEDPKNVGKLRAQAGLEPLAEYKRKFFEFHKQIANKKKRE